MLDCPVCAKPVERESAPTSVYKGVTYYFRCPNCKTRFDADPEHFLIHGADPEHGGCGGHAHGHGNADPSDHRLS